MLRSLKAKIPFDRKTAEYIFLSFSVKYCQNMYTVQIDLKNTSFDYIIMLIIKNRRRNF